jgi:site-specific DNA-methyltransferase (adenine-specific)
VSEAVTLYEDATDRWHLVEGEALLALAKLPDACVDAVVTDPPYGIDFVGAAWDGKTIREGRADLSGPEAFQRWSMAWAQQVRRVLKPGGHLIAFGAPRTFHRLACGVEDAGLEIRDQLMWLYAQGFPKSRRLPDGQGTTLKPAYEPILLARAPMDGTTAETIARWGTGALNTEASRVHDHWPAHLALSHADGCTDLRCTSECPRALADASRENQLASRLFFHAKAAKAEREAGCEQLPARSRQLFTGREHPPSLRRNTHPTVKPVALMRWLVGLVAPKGGLVLDPFAGSGSTGIAAVLAGRQFLGIEREGEYLDIACARLAHWSRTA